MALVICDAISQGCCTTIYEPQPEPNINNVRRYTRGQLFALRCTISKQYFEILISLNIFSYRGCRGGRNKRRRTPVHFYGEVKWVDQIPVVYSLYRTPSSVHKVPYALPRERHLIQCTITQQFSQPHRVSLSDMAPPSLYLLNPTSIMKPHALQNLTAEVTAYDSEVIILAETWMKAHHSDSAVEIPGYTVFRQDRKKRKGRGVASYVRKGFNASLLDLPDKYSGIVELLWISINVRGRSCYVGAVYHPPKAIYPTTEVQTALEYLLEYIFSRNDNSLIILAGDFNQLPDTLISSTGLITVFYGPTHAGHNLDRIYASEDVYTSTRAMISSVSTKHVTVLAQCEPIGNMGKTKTTHQFRYKSPGQHAALLRHLSGFSWQVVDVCSSIEVMFDKFYEIILDLLDVFFPLKSVSVSNRDPYFVTLYIKVLLRQCNKLMHRNKVEAANSITEKTENWLLHPTQQLSPTRIWIQKSSGRRFGPLPDPTER